MGQLFHFIYSEDGAVTVDWVLLTAAVLLLGVLTSVLAFGEIQIAARDLASFVASAVMRAGGS